MAHAHVIVAPVHELDAFGIEELAGKTIVTFNPRLNPSLYEARYGPLIAAGAVAAPAGRRRAAGRRPPAARKGLGPMTIRGFDAVPPFRPK